MVEPLGGDWFKSSSSEPLDHEIPKWGLAISARHGLSCKIPGWTSEFIDSQTIVGGDEILVDKVPHILRLDLAWLNECKFVGVLREPGGLGSHCSEELDVTDSHSSDIDLLLSLSVDVFNLSLGVKNLICECEVPEAGVLVGATSLNIAWKLASSI